jgi:hypothetical protein
VFGFAIAQVPLTASGGKVIYFRVRQDNQTNPVSYLAIYRPAKHIGLKVLKGPLVWPFFTANERRRIVKSF